MSPTASRRPAPLRLRGVVALAAALPLLGAALSGCSAGAVDVDSPQLSGSDARACAALLDALPERIAGLSTRDISPDDAPAHAWGDQGLVLTCGAPQPADFNQVSGCDEIRGVGWYFPPAEYADPTTTLTATAVGYRPRVSLTVPADYRGNVSLDALSTLADPVRQHLQLVKPCR